MLISFFFFPPIAFATTWAGDAGKLATPKDIVEKSTIILHGVVENVEARSITNSKGGQILYSLITVAVINGIRGVADGEQFAFPMIGGRKDGRAMRESGQAWLRVGEEVILFYNDAMYPLFGMVGGERGVLRVVSDGSADFVVDHGWRPLATFNSEGMVVDGTALCVPTKDEPKGCQWRNGKNPANFLTTRAASKSLDTTQVIDELRKMAGESVKSNAVPPVSTTDFEEQLRRYAED
jgi:hypothetical protein